MRIIFLISIVLTSTILNSQDYFSNRLFVKLKEDFNSNYALDKDAKLRILLYPSEIVSAKPVSIHPLLNSTFELILDKDVNLDSLILRLNQFSEIDFAEKVPLYKLFFTPNDPMYSSQWNLSKIQADLAWNLSQGCTNVKVAVTDDGFLLTHEDLVNQWHINSGEIAGNGIDDDANGYIDDWRGWDAANNDNDPSATSPTNSYFTHGTHVAGIIAGQTHNSKGIASIGYNCKMIPVKLGLSSNSSLTGAFQGLDYAINASGCDVINMSWGGGGWSATYQTLFNIAKTKGIICVAAAGNSNTSTPMYPASYNHVISVAASASTDARASFSNYGSTIDVTAPGVGIPSCLAGATNAYGNLSGTSMASPLVAGLCALMKCYNPMPADSIEACLKRTCDNINAQNPSFIGQLGAGRINAFQALQCLTKKPKSDFIALDTFQCIGKSVRYAAKSFGIPTLTYNWSFPGGSPASSTIANPVVTYATNGYKSTTLITCNSLGCDTITKSNYVNIDTPKAWLTNRKYTSYNSNPVIITVHFKGNPPFNITLTDGTNNFTQTNISSNPYFFSIVPKKDTSLISISSFSDSSCVGNRFGLDTIHRIILSGGGGAQYCESSFKFNGTPTNTVVKIDPKNGAAWKDLYSTNGFTWECWFNLGNRTTVTGMESVVTASDAQLCEDIGFIFNMPWSGGTGFGWVVSGQTGCGAPKGVIATTMSFSPNTWYHAAGVMDYSTNTMRLYINGNQVNSGTLTIPMSQRMKNSVAVTIGNQDVNFNPYHTFTPFNGKIDEVRFWNTVRTASDIQSSYKLCLPASTPNLVAYFKADEGTGTNTVSLVNGNFVGTLQNGASWYTQVDSVKNCTLCSTSLCQDSTEVNSAQTGWQALQTNGSWGSLTASSYCAGTFTANASLFPGVSASNCLWGPIINTGTRTAYNSSSHTSTSTFSGNFPYLKKQFTLPSGSIIDSVRLWMISDDYIDSVWVNNKVVYKATNPIHYGQIVMTGAEINLGNSISPLNEVIVKPGDFGGCYGTYFRMKVYYSKICGNSTSDCDTSGLVLCMSMDGNANDSTKFAHNGIVRGATLTTGRNGTSNSAYYFDGTTSHISLGVKPMLKPNAASISVWVKPHVFNSYTGGNANCIFLTKNPNNPGSYMEAYSLYLTNRSGPTKFMTVSTHQPTTNEKWFQSNQNTVLNQWTHLVLTFDTDSLKLYINGQLDNKVYKGFTNVYDALDSIMLGYSANTANKNYFKGDMDELKMYNRVLSNAEILNLYNKPFTCSCIAIQPPSDCDTTNLNTGLIAYYPLNGNANDSSGNGKHGTAYGGLTYIAGKKGLAANYDGVNDYINVNSKLLQGKSEFTVAGWFYGNQSLAYPKYFNIYQENNQGWNGAGFDLGVGNWGLSKYVFQSQWSNGSGMSMINHIARDTTIESYRWYCFVVSRKSDTLKLYLDGKLIQSTYNNFLNNPLINGILGGWVNSNDPSQSGYTKMLLDEVKFYNRALAPSEVKGYCGTCNVTQPPPCDTAGLVLCMSMDGNANDSSKFNNHGTKIGGVSNTNDRNGKSNSAFSFNGTNAYIEVPSASSIQLTNELTISLWINQTNTSTQGYRLVDKITGTTGDGYLFDTYGHPTNTTFRGRTTRFVNKEVNWHSNNKPHNLNSWVHVAVTHKNGLVSYYTNGVLDTSYTHSVTTLNTNTLPLRIGAGNPLNFYFNGAMDDLKIYRRALTASEVSNLYTKPFTCNCSSIQPLPCDTAQKFTFTQCLNDSIQISASAGSKYQWSPVLGLSNDTIRNPKVLASNNQRYLVSYTSAKNCQLIDTIDIEVKSAAIYPKMDDQLICIGDSVQMTIPIYATSIVWSPNLSISSTTSKNPFFFPTTNRTYYLEFRDTFGCLQRDTFVVNTKVCCPARARFSIPKDLLCFGETLPITNTSKGPITSFNWNFGAAVPNTFTGANPPILTFPSGGSYALRLIVTNGSCFDTMIKAVNVVHIIPNAGKDTTNCLGAFVTNLGESPISDWTYKWTPTKYLDDPNIANPKCSIINDSVNYILEIVDRNSGCKAYDTVMVYTNRKIDSTVQNSRICGGDSILFNGVQRKTTGNYYYTLKKADGICDSFINVLRLNVLQKQFINYTPKIHCEFYIDSKGKRHDTSYIERDTIRSKSLPNCDSIINITPREIFKKIYKEKTVQGCSPFRYNGKTYLVSKMKVDSNRIRGAYSGCDSIIEYINVIVYPKPKAEITPSIPNPVMYKQTVTLTASGGQTYLWLQTGSTNSEIDYKINNTQPKLYTVRVTDENDCWDTISYKIIGKLPDTCFYGFPNVFSPNQDNLNDEYIPNMDECTEIKVFAIYDRWGEKVFETNQQKGWNGSYKGKPAPMAVYLYYAELITPWGVKIHKGTFTLIR